MLAFAFIKTFRWSERRSERSVLEANGYRSAPSRDGGNHIRTIDMITRWIQEFVHLIEGL